MKHSVPHDLGLEAAVALAKAAFESYRERYSDYEPRMTWTTPSRARVSFRARGLTLRGSVDVTAFSIEVDLDVPLLLRMFEGRAVAVVEREIRAWIDKARAGAV